MVKKVDHIGIAVRSIQEVLPFYEKMLGLSLLRTEVVESQKVKVAFLGVGDVKIELLEPVSGEGPVQQFINKRGEGIHHIALGVTSIEERIKELKQKGVRMIDNHPRAGADGANIAFIHPSAANGVLYELCEKQSGGTER